MLMLVLGSNLLVTFLGWEGVGRLLVPADLVLVHRRGQRQRPARRRSSPTASATGASCSPCSWPSPSLGTVDYLERQRRGRRALPAVTATAIGLLLFVGAVGKSAQLPLYVWLPDAMAGPTPVSALIHAATMVTAGVYLMTRVNPILAAGYDWVPDVIAWVGVITALFAATIAVAQNDIKKVLAYSTISQLGYMFLAVGVGRLRGRHLPHDHPRLLQGAAVPRRPARSSTACTTSRTCGAWAACASSCRSRRPRSSSAGWPSPACRRSPASGRRTRSCCSPGAAAEPGQGPVGHRPGRPPCSPRST